MASTKQQSRDDRLIKSIFLGSGFEEIKSEGIHFEINGDKSEFDYIFAFENVIVICESTYKNKDVHEHLIKKQRFAKLFLSNVKKSLDIYRQSNEAFDKYISSSGYNTYMFQIKFVYYSSEFKVKISDTAPYKILKKEEAYYFKELVGIISKTSRFELFKYLGMELSDIGEKRKQGLSRETCSEDPFEAFILTGDNTNYPEDFYIISFYASPELLIKRAYVFRKYGWVDPDVSYQRMLKKDKLRKMREGLSKNEKVYVNNVIVTLPDTLQVRKDNSPIDIRDLKKSGSLSATVYLPEKLASVGIVDGQHRIYSYYEGRDDVESKISEARTRQNILVTGIVFPSHYSDSQRSRFEADLFLKINNTQTPVPSELTQAIETIVNPNSGLAIAKSLVNELNKSGPLEGFLPPVVGDKTTEIATSSIVRFMLLPATNPEAKKSNEMFKLWCDSHQESAISDSNRDKYIEFCRRILNEIFIGLKVNIEKQKWTVRSKNNNGILSPTVINGIIVCLRDIIKNDGVYYDQDADKIVSPDYNDLLKTIDTFNFEGYTSSQWGKLGHRLYKTFFSGLDG